MSLARLPNPPDKYDKLYMERLLNELNLQIRDLHNPGHAVHATVQLLQLPTSATGLRSGDVWRDAGAGNALKIVP